MSAAFRIEIDLGALGLDALTDGAEAAVRPAAQAGAQVLYEAAKANVARIGRKTGNLAASIYQAYSRDNSGPLRAEYHVSWNRKKAPHGHLVEFGHIQRYVTFVDDQGKWRTAVRPEARGRKKPGRKAPQAVKDAYYVPLKGGPKLVGAKPFIRPAASPQVMRKARNAMIDRYWSELQQRGLV